MTPPVLAPGAVAKYRDLVREAMYFSSSVQSCRYVILERRGAYPECYAKDIETLRELDWVIRNYNQTLYKNIRDAWARGLAVNCSDYLVAVDNLEQAYESNQPTEDIVALLDEIDSYLLEMAYTAQHVLYQAWEYLDDFISSFIDGRRPFPIESREWTKFAWNRGYKIIR